LVPFISVLFVSFHLLRCKKPQPAMQCARGCALSSINFPRGAKAYGKDDIPAHVRAPPVAPPPLSHPGLFLSLSLVPIPRTLPRDTTSAPPHQCGGDGLLSSSTLPPGRGFPLATHTDAGADTRFALTSPPTCPHFVRLQNLAAKKEVKAAKLPDPLGINKAGWNSSTMSENMLRFPDRPMMRQLSAYDSHKRADYNYRAEQLDSKATAMYIPRPSKFQTNERALDMPRLSQPHLISRCEFPVHSALEGKPRWDPATGHGGDPYGVEKAQRKVLERERLEAIEYSRRHAPKERAESLVQREERYMKEQRAAKAARRGGAATAPGGVGLIGGGAASATYMGQTGAALGGTFGSSGGYGRTGTNFGGSAALGASSYMVPVRKQTTWSLGGF
jgi:hypothetical protein